MDKNKFIADKIQKLVNSGEERNKATAIAFAEYNSMQKMQQGSTFIQSDMGGRINPNVMTRRDSLDVQRYSMKKDKDMLDRGFVLQNQEAGTYPNVHTLNNQKLAELRLRQQKNIDTQVINEKGYREPKIYDPNIYQQNIDINKYKNQETDIGVLDPMAAYLMFDRRADPTQKSVWMNPKTGDGATTYGYDFGENYRPKPRTGALIKRPIGYKPKSNLTALSRPIDSMQEGGIQYMQTAGYKTPSFEQSLDGYTNSYPQLPNSTNEPIDYNKKYIAMSNKQENLQPLSDNKKIMSKEEYDNIRLANLYGNVNPQIYGYGLGKAIDKEDGLGMAVNGLGLGLGTVKNVLSGLGDSRMSNYTYNQYRENQLDDSSEYKAMQQGGYIPQLKKKENIEIDDPNIDKTNAELLTGEYLTEDNTNPNVEIERNERVLHSDTGEIQTAVGNRHKDGGIKTNLTEGSQVLSDYTKINSKNSKYFSDVFNIKSEAGDTFAKTLDKIESKIGLKKLLKEEEELNLKIEKELQKQNPDKQTQNLNMQLLSEHSQEINKKKDELNGVRKIAFEELFEKQEMLPKKSNGEILKQEGGTQQPDAQSIVEAYAESIQKDPREIIQMMQQMSPEKQSEALSQMYQALQGESQNYQEEIAEGQMSEEQQEMKYGGEIQYMAEGDTVKGDPIRIGSKFENAALYKKQNPTDKNWKTFGQLLKEKPTESLSEIKRLHPELYNQYFKDDKIPTYDKIRSFQEGLNSKYEGIKQDYIKTYGADSAQVKSVDEAISKDKFLPMRNEYDEKQDRIVNKEIRGTDSFLGDWTATRPNFAIDILPKKDLEDVNKAGVNTASQLRDKFPDLYKKYVEPKGLTSDFWLGKVADTPIETPSTEQETVIPVVGDKVKSNKGERTVVPNIPTYYGQAPTPPEPVYKGDISLGRLNPTKISIEPNLVEASRQMMGAQGSLEGLSPTQRVVAMQNMYTQNQSATNQAISQAQIANANSQMQVDQFNIGQAGKEDLTNLQNAMSYEQRNLGGKAKYEANLARYFNNIAEVDKQNWREVNSLNLLNAKSNNFQTDGTNFYRTADDPNFNNTYGGSYANMSLADKAAIDKKRAKDSEKAYQVSIKKNA